MDYKPVFRITPYLFNLIDEISSIRSWIDESTLRVSWLPILQKEARSRATHSSTSIEGNPLTLLQVKEVEKGGKSGVPVRYDIEVSNYLKAMCWIEKQGFVVSEKNILVLHKILTLNLLSGDQCGKYKNKQNHVINERKIRIYTPPSPKTTPKLVKDLTVWLNSNETRKLHAILVCAIVHHRLVSIHPFVDGNGRIARAIGTWILYQRGFDSDHIFSLDDFFAGDRKKYYMKIQQARELDDDLTPWIEYVAEGIKSTLLDVKKRIEGLQISSRTPIYLSPRQEELVKILMTQPFANVADLKKKMKLTRARINQIIDPLIKRSVIIREGKSRATRYRLKVMLS